MGKDPFLSDSNPFSQALYLLLPHLLPPCACTLVYTYTLVLILKNIKSLIILNFHSYTGHGRTLVWTALQAH